jgi:hypothetical protein
MAMENRIRWRKWALLILTAVLTAGCSGAAGQGPATAASRPASQAAAPLPIERYLFSNGQLSRLVQARNLLAAQCVRRFGLDWNPKPPPVPQDASLDAANIARRYGVTDPAAAARLGYHQASPPPSKRPDDPAPTADQQTALSGSGPDGSTATTFHGLRIPAGGCIGEANMRISGDPARLGDDDLPSRINVDSYQQAMADSRVIAAFRAWSGCMRQRGYDYPDPTQVPGKKPQFTGPEPTPTEIAVAVADVSCKQQTGLVAVWSAVDAADQNTAIKQHAAELVKVEQNLREQLRNVAAVLDG